MAPKRSAGDAIDLTQTDSEDDSEAPPPRKKDSQSRAPVPSSSKAAHNNGGAEQGSASGNGSTSVNTAASISAGEDRKAAEQARLLRQQAREASGTTAPSTSYNVTKAATRPTVSTISDLTNLSNPSASTSAVATSSTSSVRDLSSSSSATASGPRPTERFWDGAIKRVSNIYVPDTSSFTFDAILGPKEELESAIVCSCYWDLEWSLSHFQKDVPLLLIMPSGKGEGKGKGKLETLSSAIRPNTFKVSPVEYEQPGGWTGSMHSKPIVLYYKTFCRVIIASANQVDFDWDRNDNAFFVQDFPHLPASAQLGSAVDNPTHTKFSKDLLVALTTLSASARFLVPFREYDFSKSDQVQLVVSNQGAKFYDWAGIDRGGGLASMANAVKALGFSEGGKCEIIGSGGGAFFFKSESWLSKSFPKHILHKAQNKRPGVIAHTKMIIAIQQGGDEPKGFAYIGSHNLNTAAWGTLQNTKYGPGISIPNYEMGVIIPIRGETMAEVQRKASELASFHLPSVPYGPNDVPWMQDLHK
ncbi:hypothetical protein P7C70_g4853, partial [Phenoliferia sp. Uapishka_3]